jgi:hypothetical protein
MAESIPYLLPTQFQEIIFPPITHPKIPAQHSHFFVSYPHSIGAASIQDIFYMLTYLLNACFVHFCCRIRGNNVTKNWILCCNCSFSGCFRPFCRSGARYRCHIFGRLQQRSKNTAPQYCTVYSPPGIYLLSSSDGARQLQQRCRIYQR